MRGIADEDHAAMHEAVEPAAIEGVDRNPFSSKSCAASTLSSRARTRSGSCSASGVGVGAKLQIDAPDVVGLAMHQRRLAGMERRREPETALGRKIRRHVHIGDEEFVLEGDAGKVESEERRDGRARAVGGNQPIGVEPVGAVRASRW